MALSGLRSGKHQKQPYIGVLKKKCSENMQQIYRKTPMVNFMENYVDAVAQKGVL